VRLRDGLTADTEAAPGEDSGLVVASGGEVEALLTVAEARPVDAVLDEIPVAAEVALPCGLRLLGYEWPADAAAGREAQVRTWWTFADAPAGERPCGRCVAVRLMDSSGTAVAEAAGLGLPEEHWAPGYLLEQTHILALPAGLPAGTLDLAVEVVALGESGVAAPAGEGTAGETVAVLGTVPVLAAPR